MKKLTFMLLSIALQFSAMAEIDDVLLAFQTSGPDKYLDGSTVLDNEVYALVWTSNNCQFAGFKADGSMAQPTDKLIIPAAVAKNGRCPGCLFQLNKTMFEDLSRTGTMNVYLLDTRDLRSGKLSPLSDRKLTKVNACSFALASSCEFSQIGSQSIATLNASAKSGAVALAFSADFSLVDNHLLTTETNIVEVVHTNIVTDIVVKTNIAIKTVYDYVTITNSVYEELERTALLDSKKTTAYAGYAFRGEEKVGIVEIKVNRLNSYKIAAIQLKFQANGWKRKRTISAYGIVVDGKWMYANARDESGCIEFSGDYAVGQIVVDRVQYDIELEIKR